MTANLYALFKSHFPSDSFSPALIERQGKILTYGDLDSLSARLAGVLIAEGARPGDRIAVQVEKSITAVALYLACLRAGLVYLPLNTAYLSDELEYFIDDAKPAVVVGEADSKSLPTIVKKHAVKAFLTLEVDGYGTLVSLAAEIEPFEEIYRNTQDDLAAILYSSGTTGRPKGVMLSHGNLSSNAKTLHQLWQFGPKDVLLHALPIFHTHGLFAALNTTLLNGTAILFHEKFVAEHVIEDLRRATVFMGVPTYYVRLLASKEFGREVCKGMRLFVSGSAPLPERTFNDFEKRTGHLILERYGMTEAGMITSAHTDKPRRAGKVGWPLPDVKLRLNARNQEIEIKGPNVFSGYWGKPNETAANFTSDKYFKTGDIGSFAKDGMISIIGRAKDMIISGGFNVYPKEVESCIDEILGVDESAVVGMPHPDFGEAGLAIVTLKDGSANLTESKVIGALKNQLANYKIPKAIVFVDSLPRNAMGKVQKALLRDRYKDLWFTKLESQNT
ncbi:MAG: AMP-binding protein [Rhodospirillaceae bacterium]